MIILVFLVIKKAQRVLGFLEKSLKNILAYRYRFKNFEILPNTKTASGSCSLKITKFDICFFLFHGFIGPKPFGSGGGAVWDFAKRRQAFRSKKVRATFRISHQQEFCKFSEANGLVASRLRRSAGARPALRDAAKSHGSPNETETFIRV